MRYLKEYNNYVMWKRIDPQEYVDRMGHNFYRSEIKSILSIFPKDFKFEFSEGFLGGVDEAEIYIKRGRYTYYRINKYEDEWFIFADLSTADYKFYKCDQLDGLLDCIQKNVIEK
jgi:hypothetical protein